MADMTDTAHLVAEHRTTTEASPSGGPPGRCASLPTPTATQNPARRRRSSRRHSNSRPRDADQPDARSGDRRCYAVRSRFRHGTAPLARRPRAQRARTVRGHRVTELLRRLGRMVRDDRMRLGLLPRLPRRHHGRRAVPDTRPGVGRQGPAHRTGHSVGRGLACERSMGFRQRLLTRRPFHRGRAPLRRIRRDVDR